MVMVNNFQIENTPHAPSPPRTFPEFHPFCQRPASLTSKQRYQAVSRCSKHTNHCWQYHLKVWKKNHFKKYRQCMLMQKNLFTVLKHLMINWFDKRNHLDWLPWKNPAWTTDRAELQKTMQIHLIHLVNECWLFCECLLLFASHDAQEVMLVSEWVTEWVIYL